MPYNELYPLDFLQDNTSFVAPSSILRPCVKANNEQKTIKSGVEGQTISTVNEDFIGGFLFIVAWSRKGPD